MNTAYIVSGELIDHDTIKLKEPIPLENGEVRVLVEAGEKKESKKRRIGGWKDRIQMLSDFNDPLEDFREYME